MRGIVASLTGIVIAGASGGLAGWAAVHALGWTGVAAALAAVVIAMVVALAVFAALVVIVDRVRR